MDKSRYVEILRAAIAWGTSRERAAWSRTLEQIDLSAGTYRREDLDTGAAAAVHTVNDRVTEWFDLASAKLDNTASIPDLEQPPEDIWCGMVCMNRGIFEQEPGNDLLSPLLITIPSTIRGTGPLYLSLNLDGWGIQPASSD